MLQILCDLNIVQTLYKYGENLSTNLDISLADPWGPKKVIAPVSLKICRTKDDHQRRPHLVSCPVFSAGSHTVIIIIVIKIYEVKTFLNFNLFPTRITKTCVIVY